MSAASIVLNCSWSGSLASQVASFARDSSQIPPPLNVIVLNTFASTDKPLGKTDMQWLRTMHSSSSSSATCSLVNTHTGCVLQALDGWGLYGWHAPCVVSMPWLEAAQHNCVRTPLQHPSLSPCNACRRISLPQRSALAAEGGCNSTVRREVRCNRLQPRKQHNPTGAERSGKGSPCKKTPPPKKGAIVTDPPPSPGVRAPPPIHMCGSLLRPVQCA
jgi:hypothetical protein